MTCPKQCITKNNFPVYRADNHIGKSFAQCPFSTQAPEKRVRFMLRELILDEGGPDVLSINPATDDFFVTNLDTIITTYLGYSRNDHTTTSGNREDDNNFGLDKYIKNPTYSGTVYMYTDSRRGQYGFECAFNNCPYRQNNNGKRYFYS